jgi:preprotein translocase subunit SecG
VIYVLYFLHVIVSLFLILVVLLQQGKGADLSVFGGGASQAAFGARGAVNIFQRLTVIGFVLFIFTTLTIGLMQGQDDSVMSSVPVTEEEAAAETTAPELAVDAEEGAAAPSEGAAPPMATDAEEEGESGTAEGSDSEPPPGGGS